MRIIAGQCKGHHLAPLKGGKTRPTQDRVRESIFNILEPQGPFIKVADLFAGSGALGLEALSRWGGTALFVEFSRPAVDCLRENIRRLKMETKTRVIQRDLSRGVRFLLNRHAPQGRGTTKHENRKLDSDPIFDLSTHVPSGHETTSSRLRRPKKDIQRMSAHENKLVGSEPIFELNSPATQWRDTTSSRAARHSSSFEKASIRDAVRRPKKDIQRMSAHENKLVGSEPIFVLKESEPFDLIFMDPPYGQGWANVIVSALLSLPLLKEKGILVLEHDLKEPIPEEVENWVIGDQRRYGQTRVSFYKFRKG